MVYKFTLTVDWVWLDTQYIYCKMHTDCAQTSLPADQPHTRMIVFVKKRLLRMYRQSCEFSSVLSKSSPMSSSVQTFLKLSFVFKQFRSSKPCICSSKFVFTRNEWFPSRLRRVLIFYSSLSSARELQWRVTIKTGTRWQSPLPRVQYPVLEGLTSTFL